jgi:hypothetical protein
VCLFVYLFKVVRLAHELKPFDKVAQAQNAKISRKNLGLFDARLIPLDDVFPKTVQGNTSERSPRPSFSPPEAN